MRNNETVTELRLLTDIIDNLGVRRTLGNRIMKRRMARMPEDIPVVVCENV